MLLLLVCRSAHLQKVILAHVFQKTAASLVPSPGSYPQKSPCSLPRALQVRGLAAVTKQTQQALLQSCSVFSRALGCPSPVGPFTSFPPQL